VWLLNTKGWKTEKLVGWLDTHPVDGVEDINYLTRIVANRKALATQIAQQQDNASDGGKKNWTGKYRYLCLIHCLVDIDNTKCLYLQHNKIETGRLHLDNRNSLDKRDATVWEKVSDTFNDPTFAPETEAVANFHTDYVKSEILLRLYMKEMSAATPEKYGDKFSTMMIQMKRCISKWERSGQGKGGIIEPDGNEGEEEKEDETATVVEFGSFANWSKVALDSPHSFLPFYQPYLLYCWHMLEKHNLLGSSLNQLNISFAATNEGTEVPLVILDRASWMMADEDNAPWESTMQSNNTPGNKQSVVDFTHLSKSIKGLGEKATEAAKIQAEKLQKNRVHKSQVLEKTHQHESLEREKIHQHKVLQREKTLKHEALEKKGL
jgi:hypothetical protein